MAQKVRLGGELDPRTVEGIAADAKTIIDRKNGNKRQDDINAELAEAIAAKQATLVSGTNIKTINKQSILGPGNIDIQGGGGSQVQSDWNQADNTQPDYIKNKPNIPDVSGKAEKSEMSVTPGTGANADKTTIQLKQGTSATVLTQHQDVSGFATKSEVDTIEETVGQRLDAQDDTIELLNGSDVVVVDSLDDVVSPDTQKIYRIPNHTVEIDAQGDSNALIDVDYYSYLALTLEDNTKYEALGDCVFINTQNSTIIGKSITTTVVGSEQYAIAAQVAGSTDVADLSYTKTNNNVEPTFYTDYMCIDDTTTPVTWKKIGVYTIPGIDKKPTLGSNKLVESGGVEEGLTKITGSVGGPIDTSYYAQVVGMLDEGVFHSQGGNYPNYRCRLIKVVAGRTVRITPLSASTRTIFCALKSNVLVNGQTADLCAGVSAETVTYDVTDYLLPSDCKYLYILSVRYSGGSSVDCEPTLAYTSVPGLLDTKLDKSQGVGNAGKFAKVGVAGNLEMANIGISDVSGLSTEIEDMSDDIDTIEGQISDTETRIVAVPLTMHEESGTVKGFWNTNGAWTTTVDERRGSDKIDVTEGEKYLVTTKIGASTAIAYLAQWNGDSWVGIPSGFTGGSGDAVDRQYIVPTNVTKIAVCSYNGTEPTMKKVVTENVLSFYTKTESDTKYATKEEIPESAGKYGVKWSVSDADDLGQRCFNAIGLNATIGQGNTNGSSDFDSIYPWSEMKRCNIYTNSNGAKIVTFEGETGFALDGSNGDVFVRIPKFCVEKYVDNGYEYRVVSRNQGSVHPVFIEEGKEIDEIFVSAFEGYVDNNELKSIAGVIPTSNIVAQDFLDAAQVKGSGYTLYDMRAVDAIWTLASVEFGKRNTNQYLGYGFADFMQPVDNPDTHYLTIIEAANNTHSVKVPLMSATYKRFMPIGSNITVCDTEQENILTQAKITNIEDGDNYTQFTFDGPAINVTTNCFIGSAACTTNFSESCGNDVKLNWHTGRPLFISGTYADRQNPVRYRWIENIIGSLWHFLPDVTFKDLQMYVCDNIKDYEFHKYTNPYRPVGKVLPQQSDNGQKNDNVGVNHWISALQDDIFAKGNCFGKSYSDSLTSQKAFGAYYYLRTGVRCISNGGGFDHEIRCNMLTNRGWQSADTRWYLYGARLMYKNI